MRTISKSDLTKILVDHREWRESAGRSGARANLADAHLAGANLAGAYLADANLADADLAHADLAGAHLAGANLADANLADAKNVPSTAEPDPKAPRKTRADWEAQRAQNATERARRYREAHPEVPVVENIDAKILESIGPEGSHLEMGAWHTCNTTHCRGGWAIHHAGKAGYDLERKYDSAQAAAMIYRASTGRAPHFYASNERALDDIKRCAAEQTSLPPPPRTP